MQKETAGDQELNLKKRARRRLVGAIALVLLMIIVLPMILKDRAATNPQDKITISLPGEQQTVTPAVPSDFDSSIVPAEPATAPLTTETTEPTAAPIVDPEAAATKPEPAKDTPVKEAPAKEASKPKVETAHHFYVQIGVFSDEANVKQLQAKLSDLGYKSQTEKIDTAKGKKIRLKTQLFADRNEAAIALENIKDSGLTGMVVSQ
jgi:DedD protein